MEAGVRKQAGCEGKPPSGGAAAPVFLLPPQAERQWPPAALRPTRRARRPLAPPTAGGNGPTAAAVSALAPDVSDTAAQPQPPAVAALSPHPPQLLGSTSPASATSAPLEGRPVPWAQLGPLALIEQRLGVGGASFRLLAPQDVDAVFDMYLDRGGGGGGGGGGGWGRKRRRVEEVEGCGICAGWRPTAHRVVASNGSHAWPA